MTKKCIVCKVEPNPLNDYSFHKFPSNDEVKQKWMSALQLTTVPNSKTTFICGNHFHEDEFYPTTRTQSRKRRRLLPDAVPSCDLTPIVHRTSSQQNDVSLQEEATCSLEESATDDPEIADGINGVPGLLTNGNFQSLQGEATARVHSMTVRSGAPSPSSRRAPSHSSPVRHLIIEVPAAGEPQRIRVKCEPTSPGGHVSPGPPTGSSDGDSLAAHVKCEPASPEPNVKPEPGALPAGPRLADAATQTEDWGPASSHRPDVEELLRNQNALRRELSALREAVRRHDALLLQLRAPPPPLGEPDAPQLQLRAPPPPPGELDAPTEPSAQVPPRPELVMQLDGLRPPKVLRLQP